MMNAGTRVGALLGSSDDEVKVLGYGVYEGDFPVDASAVGWLAEMLREHQRPNPRIKLDSGKVVWGCECWWGPENRVTEALSKTPKKLTFVDIDEVRRQFVRESR